MVGNSQLINTDHQYNDATEGKQGHIPDVPCDGDCKIISEDSSLRYSYQDNDNDTNNDNDINYQELLVHY